MDDVDPGPIRRSLGSAVDRRWAIGAALVGAIAWLRAPGETPARSAKSLIEASFAGTFAITEEAGDSPVFVVDESGTGEEEMRGRFTYRLSVRQNGARLPTGCGPNSSTGTGGSAVLTFADGELHLHRREGTSCFAFPTIMIEEEWTVASGTGRHTGANGRLVRAATGDVRFGSIDGTWQGTIRTVESRKGQAGASCLWRVRFGIRPWARLGRHPGKRSG